MNFSDKKTLKIFQIRNIFFWRKTSNLEMTFAQIGKVIKKIKITYRKTNGERANTVSHNKVVPGKR